MTQQMTQQIMWHIVASCRRSFDGFAKVSNLAAAGASLSDAALDLRRRAVEAGYF